MATDLVIGIGAEYKGRAAFAKASKEVSALDKAVGVLGKKFIAVFAAQRILAYSKASAFAYAQDERSAKALSQTLTNLGLAFESTGTEAYVKNLEKVYHIADDQLRPSLAKLLQVTGSFTTSQKILNAALDASAGTGLGLDETVSTLSQAYVGNLKGLKKLNLGLTQTELTSMSFQQVLEKINATFTGQGKLAASSATGGLAALSIAAGNAKEIIGQGLVDAISKLGGGAGGIDKLTTSMEGLAKVISKIASGVGGVAGFVATGVGFFAQGVNDVSNFLKKIGVLKKDTTGGSLSGKVEFDAAIRANDKFAAARAKAEAAAIKRQKELAALTAKQKNDAAAALALKKAQNILDTSSKVMNLDLIQNTAALQGKITQDETKRLELQQAILLGNADAAGKLSQELIATQIAAMKAANTDPFASWTEGAKSALAALGAVRAGLAGLGVPSVAIPSTPATPALPAITVPPSLSNTPMGGYNGAGGVGAQGGSFYVGGQKITIDLNLNGDLGQLVTASTVNNSANGNQNQLSRNFNFSSVS